MSVFRRLCLQPHLLLNFCQAGVEEEEEKWRQIVEEKDGEIQRTRSALSQAQVERQADLVRYI